MANLQSKNHIIYDINGIPLHQGHATSRREFIISLVKQRKSFANAILVAEDFSNLDISGLDFSNAILKDTNFTSATAHKTNFTSADLTGVTAYALDAANANFNEISITKSDNKSIFSGSNLKRSSWVNAKIENAVFNDAKMQGSVFSKASVKRNDFISANMSDTEWVDATSVQNNMESSIFQMDQKIRIRDDISDSEKDFIVPNRTYKTKSILNNFKKAQLSSGYSKFKADRFIGFSSKELASIGIFISFFLVAEPATGMLLSLSTVGGYALFKGGVEKAKDYLFNYLSPCIGEVANHVAPKIANFFTNLYDKAVNMKNMAAMVIFDSPTAKMFKKFLNQNSDHKAFYRKFHGYEIAIADQDNLAKALSRVSEIYMGRPFTSNKTCILRDSSLQNDTMPSMLVAHQDGTKEIYWKEQDITIKWDKNGQILNHSQYDEKLLSNLTGYNPDVKKVIKEFNNAILNDNKVSNFKYDLDTSYIKIGNKKSAIVTRTKDHALRDDGSPIALLNGQIYTQKFIDKRQKTLENQRKKEENYEKKEKKIASGKNLSQIDNLRLGVQERLSALKKQRENIKEENIELIDNNTLENEDNVTVIPMRKIG